MPGEPGDGGKRTKYRSLKGTVMVDANRGSPRVRIWPRKRPKGSLHPTTLKNMADFREANIFTKYTIAREQAMLQRVTHGTPFYQRDIQVMALYGRLYSLQWDGRGKLWPMAAVNEVSQSLDVLGFEHGSILFRGQDLWQHLPATESGLVLVSLGPDADPEWGRVSPDTGLGFQGARMLKNATQNILAAATVVTWQVADFDHGSLVDLANDHFVIPAAFDGHMAELTLGTVGSDTAGTWISEIQVQLGGVGAWVPTVASGTGSNHFDLNPCASGPILVNTGDKFRALVAPSIGSLLFNERRNFFSIKMLGKP